MTTNENTKSKFSVLPTLPSSAIFPLKLHRLLEEATEKGYADIISWCPDGKAFKVHDTERFSIEIMTSYFGSNKYRSFQKNLNMWSFKAARKGKCSHPLFRRGAPKLLNQMKRQLTSHQILRQQKREVAAVTWNQLSMATTTTMMGKPSSFLWPSSTIFGGRFPADKESNNVLLTQDAIQQLPSNMFENSARREINIKNQGVPHTKAAVAFFEKETMLAAGDDRFQPQSPQNSSITIELLGRCSPSSSSTRGGTEEIVSLSSGSVVLPPFPSHFHRSGVQHNRTTTSTTTTSEGIMTSSPATMHGTTSSVKVPISFDFCGGLRTRVGHQHLRGRTENISFKLSSPSPSHPVISSFYPSTFGIGANFPPLNATAFSNNAVSNPSAIVSDSFWSEEERRYALMKQQELKQRSQLNQLENIRKELAIINELQRRLSNNIMDV